MAVNSFPFIGQMDQKIKVFEFTRTQNAVGEDKEVKVLLASPFAYVEDVGGGESIDGKILHSINRSYTIRYNKEIARSGVHYIVEDSGVEFHITHVIPIGRKRFLKLITENVE